MLSPIMKKSESSRKWLSRQAKDPYVKKARESGYRSRAAFKLIELDDKLRFIRKARNILDIGCAPGSWCQVVRARNTAASIIGIDLLRIDPIEGVKFIQGDFFEKYKELDGPLFDLILCDMAHNMTGHRATDMIRMEEMIKDVCTVTFPMFSPGGVMIVKSLAAGPNLLGFLKDVFGGIRIEKPQASRTDSAECYIALSLPVAK